MDANYRRGALALLLLASGSVAAQGVSVADLDKIQSEAILYRAELAREQAQRELSELRGNSGGTVGSTAGRDAGPHPAALGRFGANGRTYVRFGYADGSFAEAAVGESIPGGYRVVRFDDAGVELAQGRARHRIGFAMRAPALTPAVPAQPQFPTPPAPSFAPPPPTSVPPMERR